MTVQELLQEIESYGRVAYFPSSGEYRIITQAEPTVVDAQMITHLLTEGLLERDGRTYRLTRKGRGML